jgi:hypothetical protein
MTTESELKSQADIAEIEKRHAAINKAADDWKRSHAADLYAWCAALLSFQAPRTLPTRVEIARVIADATEADGITNETWAAFQELTQRRRVNGPRDLPEDHVESAFRKADAILALATLPAPVPTYPLVKHWDDMTDDERKALSTPSSSQAAPAAVLTEEEIVSALRRIQMRADGRGIDLGSIMRVAKELHARLSPSSRAQAGDQA